MNNPNNDILGVAAGTLNHKGNLVHNDAYSWVETSPSGWALICTNNSVCHYVDPDALRPRKGEQ